MNSEKIMFIDANLTEKSPTFKDLEVTLNLSVEEIRIIRKQYSEVLERIQQARNIYNRKKDLTDKSGKELFKFANFKKFCTWYIERIRVCDYCGTDENVLFELFDNGILPSTRGGKRGKTLEIERKDSGSNIYSEKNCVLACYFCNNHKSDVISENDHRKYFADKIGEYLRDKHQNG